MKRTELVVYALHGDMGESVHYTLEDAKAAMQEIREAGYEARCMSYTPAGKRFLDWSDICETRVGEV